LYISLCQRVKTNGKGKIIMGTKRERLEVYKCEVCGNIVEILTGSMGSLVCCNKEMKLMAEKIEDAKAEKHVPVLHERGSSVKITVGAIPHPMEEAHYIEWIEVLNGDYVNRKYLKPSDEPAAEFYVGNHTGLILRSYCNLHGLWKKNK
jgi:superoxide reductase